MKLSPIQRSVLAVARTCIESGDELPTHAEIADELGRDRESIANAFYRLRKIGALETDGRCVRMVVDVPTEPTKAAAPETPKPNGKEIQAKLLALARYCERAPAKWPPRRNIMEALGISKSTFERHLAALCESGAIRRVEAGNYRLGDR